MKSLLGFLILLFVFESVSAQKAKCYDLKAVLAAVPTPLYLKHLEASKKFKIPVLENSKSISKFRKNGKLSPVDKSGKGYKIQKLEHSQALLVPKAEQVMKQIVADFLKASKGSTLTITSLTRTLEDQCNLRKVNPNASIGISSHNFGNSFDISYVRFNNRLERNNKLDKMLHSVLQRYEKAGKIHFIREKQQNCYHVTVRK